MSNDNASPMIWQKATADYFLQRLSEIRSVLTVLIANISDEEWTNDEPLFLSTQAAHEDVLNLERLSYDIGELEEAGVSLSLMWARATLGIFEGAFSSSGWKRPFERGVCAGNLSAAKRQIESAQEKVEKLNASLFQKAA